MSIFTAIKNWWREPSCCEVNGVANCQQGRTCPVREGTHKPAEAVHQIGEPIASGKEVLIDFDQVGTAGPFPIIDGRVRLPTETIMDLAHMLNTTSEALSGKSFRCHDADACEVAQKPCPSPGACGIQSPPQ